MAVTICYVGTPITPASELLSIAGRHFCVSYFYREKTNMRIMEGIASGLMLDSGAYSAWKKNVEFTDEYWDGYHAWCDPLLDRPTTWAVIPDQIGAPSQLLDALIKRWPHGQKGAPVFHLFADFEHGAHRMLRLLDEWPRVCVGWAHPPSVHPIMSDAFQEAMDTLWNEIAKRHSRTPHIHMFRGTQLTLERWPFASVDSTDIATNHHRAWNTARAMADRWDAAQCPARWTHREPATTLWQMIEEVGNG